MGAGNRVPHLARRAPLARRAHGPPRPDRRRLLPTAPARAGAAGGGRCAGPDARLRALRGAAFDPERIAPEVRRFYEATADYRLDVWTEWSDLFRPFGWALAALFSRRLEQLNVPRSPLSVVAGMSNSLVELRNPGTGEPAEVAWVRENKASGETVYAGSYSIARLPIDREPVIRVVFPLPNGNATVLLRPVALADRSLLLLSRGAGFGDAGFYFVVAGAGRWAWVRSVRSFHEAIRVFVDPEGELRTDHQFFLWGRRFMRLHYRMQERAGRA